MRFYQTDNAKIVNVIAKINKIKRANHHLKPGREIKLP